MTRRRSSVTVPSELLAGEGDVLTTGNEFFLLKLRYKLGRLISVSGRQPIPLADAQTAWVVYAGRLDVFAAPLDAAGTAGVRRHLLRVEAGQLVLGLGCEDEIASQPLSLIAIGGPDTRVIQLPRARLEQLAQEPESSVYVIALLDGWVQGLAAALVADLPPQASCPLQPGDFTLEPLRPAHSRRGVVWIAPTAGDFCWLGNPALPAPPGALTPLAGPLWVRATASGTLRALSTADFCAADPSWGGVAHFHHLVRTAVAQRLAEAARADAQHLRARAEQNQAQVAHALTHLAGVLNPADIAPLRDGPADATQTLLSACRLVGQALGVPIQAPPTRLTGAAETAQTRADPLNDIARASRLRVRLVTLPEGWARNPSAPLLAYWQADTPVALLPRRPRLFAAGGYDLVDPRSGARIPVTPAIAAELAPFAHVFYRPLPARPLAARDLFRLGFQGARAELLSVALTGAAIGLLGLAIPLMIGALFNTIIPGAARAQLWQVGLILFVCTFSAALFLLTQNIAVLRLEGKWDSAVLPAIWDRLLRLPPAFFRRGAAGDLAERAMGLDLIRRALSGAAVAALLTAPTALCSLGLLFYYDTGLAWAALGAAALLGGITLLAWRVGVAYQRQLAEQQGQIAGMVLEFATGIAKLRVAGAEARIFARWARAFGAQRTLAFKARNAANGLAVFNAAFPVVALLTLFALMAWSSPAGARLSTGDFIAFNAAFGQFLLTALTISATLLSLLQVAPLYERVRPILQTLPEVAPLQTDPGALRGEIELSHVVFRYREDEPPVLKDVSLQVRPGEFVALVGPSGCGKSTLIRLLLGFERPLSGAIYYDGQDLLGLDVECVRRQIGVVLQNGQLLTGTLLSNIIGALPLSVDDAWEAARLVGLSDDIAEMPMGMHTLVSDGSSTLSGGQRQRLLIARAIVSKPRILLFDEATSALDNRSQALVSASLEQLQATRIVVAHRLSTILHADRIFVLDEGRIVQSGTYAELSKQHGLFADLVRRQML